jgi:surfactin synthase thioesterase subunit
MLPAIVPKARIMVYNYDSKWHANAPKIRLQTCGEELVKSIHDFYGDIHRPIIFIGHSLGGNVIEYVGR